MQCPAPDSCILQDPTRNAVHNATRRSIEISDYAQTRTVFGHNKSLHAYVREFPTKCGICTVRLGSRNVSKFFRGIFATIYLG